jgi:hypothetical protein
MAERVPDSECCRLCSAPLHSFELPRRLCTTCEGYAEQLGVRDEDEFEQIVEELLHEPSFRRLTGLA